MGYVENNLIKGEEIVFKTKHHWIIFVGPIIFTILGIVMFFNGFATNSPTTTVGGLFVFGMAVAFLIKSLVAMSTDEFAITNKRVIIKVGLLRRVTLEMNREKVESIIVDQSIFGRMLNYGSLAVTGTGSSRQVFAAIANPIQFKKIVQEH